MNYLVDTSVLIRQADSRSPDRILAVNAIATLKLRGDDLFIASQNIIEFWAVATRPQAANGLGLTLTEAERERVRLETLFVLHSDPVGLYVRWVRLVNNHGVSGKQVHDTRLAAFALEAQIPCILTFNIVDFTRFSDITAVHPSSI